MQLTEESEAVIVRSREAARRLNHPYVGSEHLLLALAEDPSLEVGEYLTAIGVSPPRIEALIEQILGKGKGEVAGEVKLTPLVQRIIGESRREAERRESSVVCPVHILSALSSVDEGIAMAVLNCLGVRLDAVREEMGLIHLLTPSKRSSLHDMAEEVRREDQLHQSRKRPSLLRRLISR